MSLNPDIMNAHQGRSYAVIVAARMGSRRLPGKAMLPLKGTPMLEAILARLMPIGANRLVLATTRGSEDDVLADIAIRLGIAVFRGTVDDVMLRYVEAAKLVEASHIVRVTADCPFVDYETLNYCLSYCDNTEDFDLATTKGAFPVGIDYEIYPKALMEQINMSESLSREEREHLTPHLYNSSNHFRVVRISPKPEWICSDYTFTLDTPDDYQNISRWTANFPDLSFSISELMALVRRQEKK